MSDAPKPDRRQFLAGAAAATGLAGAVGYVAYDAIQNDTKFQREMNPIKEAFDSMPRTQMTRTETVKSGAVATPLIPGDPSMGMTVTPGKDSERKTVYVMPTAFLKMSSSELADPRQIARIFKVRLTEDNTQNPDKYIGCYLADNAIHLITVGNVKNRAEEITGIIRSASEKKELPPESKTLSR